MSAIQSGTYVVYCYGFIATKSITCIGIVEGKVTLRADHISAYTLLIHIHLRAKRMALVGTIKKVASWEVRKRRWSSSYFPAEGQTFGNGMKGCRIAL